MWKSYESRMMAILLAAGAWALTCGCNVNAPTPPSADATTQPSRNQPFVKLFETPKVSATTLWAINCTRCHNAVSSKSFSPDEWELIVHHMRLRANLTGEETRQITEFLKSGS